MTQPLPTSIEDLAERFYYTPDWFHTMRVLRGTRRLRGDCEDFAATALWIEAGGSSLRAWWWLITFQAVFWHTVSPRGHGHAMLWLRGRGWIDNWHPAWGPRHLPLRWPLIWPAVALLLFMGRFG
jgi:hypothetical protein